MWKERFVSLFYFRDFHITDNRLRFNVNYILEALYNLASDSYPLYLIICGRNVLKKIEKIWICIKYLLKWTINEQWFLVLLKCWCYALNESRNLFCCFVCQEIIWRKCKVAQENIYYIHIDKFDERYSSIK